jgi:hypothetical protein
MMRVGDEDADDPSKILGLEPARGHAFRKVASDPVREHRVGEERLAL